MENEIIETVKEVTNNSDQFLSILPYIVTVVCSCISGFASYFITRKQTKADLAQLEKQHELDIEKEREKFAMEKEKMEIEHRHQIELLQKEAENSLGASITSSIFSEALKMPEVRQQLSAGMKNGARNRKR